MEMKIKALTDRIKELEARLKRLEKEAVRVTIDPKVQISIKQDRPRRKNRYDDTQPPGYNLP